MVLNQSNYTCQVIKTSEKQNCHFGQLLLLQFTTTFTSKIGANLLQIEVDLFQFITGVNNGGNRYRFVKKSINSKTKTVLKKKKLLFNKKSLLFLWFFGSLYIDKIFTYNFDIRSKYILWPLWAHVPILAFTMRLLEFRHVILIRF